MSAPTPAEVPGQGEVERLAVAICAADETVDLRYGMHVADAILASDWLAERDAEVARAAVEGALSRVDEAMREVAGIYDLTDDEVSGIIRYCTEARA